MTMRNWWIEVEIEGRKAKLVGGPRAKDGGFEIVIYQRDTGESVHALTVTGIAYDDGKLELTWTPAEHTTQR